MGALGLRVEVGLRRRDEVEFGDWGGIRTE